MTIEEFREMMQCRETIHFGTDAFAFSVEHTQKALRLQGELNTGYHTPEEIQRLFAELTGEPVNETLFVFPPFYTDFGQNIHIGRYVTLIVGGVPAKVIRKIRPVAQNDEERKEN